ncbi:MAG: hypothetical protein L0099_07250 [Acidobacteria bacterium]|nr:hypothetical protein [Acidobacteriota bacterium]
MVSARVRGALAARGTPTRRVPGAESLLTRTVGGERIVPGDRLFGGGNAPQFRTAAGRVISAEEVQLPGQLQDVSAEALSSVRQFLDPTLQGEQVDLLEGIRRRSAGQGIFGGAVEGLQGDLTTRFLARNRAEAFNPAVAAVTERLGQLRSTVSPFVQQGGALTQLLGRGSSLGVASGDRGAFAEPLLRALGALGLGRAGALGVASASGRTLRSGQLGEDEVNIAAATSEFLSPSLTPEGLASLRRSRAALGGRGANRSQVLGGLERGLRGEQRGAAASFLTGELGSRLSEFESGAQFLQGQTLPLAFLAGQNDLGTARQILGIDTSQLGQAFQALLGRQGPTGGGTPGAGGGLLEKIRGRTSSVGALTAQRLGRF